MAQLPAATNEQPLAVSLTGFDLINQPMLNKGTAFFEREREQFQLHGILPPHVGTLDEQVTRRLMALRMYETAFEKYSFLRDLQDLNETLFYALLVRHLEELLPLVYTPTVGEGCQRFSEIWRKPRGLFLSYPYRRHIADILAHPRYDHVRAIVVSDGERILGLGDQGAGGMGIPIGKLALYTACAGIHPEQTLPIFLDVGTDNPERLADPLYIGWRHERICGTEYDEFIETFVSTVMKRWPDALLQWEDFAGANALRLLERYRERLCTFNDDIQGTAAIALGALLSAINITRTPLTAQRIVLFGAGAAGVGIGTLLRNAMVEAGLSPTEASRRLYALDRNGLLIEGMNGLPQGQKTFVQNRSAVTDWVLQHSGEIGLLDVVANAKPTVLIGVSGQPAAFTEVVIRTMAAHCPRPVIFALSNPTARSEASAINLAKWTDGRALIGLGSPFPPVERGGKLVPVDQINNCYVFPGVGLGVLATRAHRVTDGMFMAAAKALTELSPSCRNGDERLLPPITQIRAVSVEVARAVAYRAQLDGVADVCEANELDRRIRAQVWEPAYRPYIRKIANPLQSTGRPF
jgi:malate dehydrogenase (oxaloacetate-decarboxylating)